MSSDEEKPTTNFEFSKAELDHFEKYVSADDVYSGICLDVNANVNSKTFSKHYDPCKEVAEKSINCLRRNPGDKDLCNDYFQ